MIFAQQNWDEDSSQLNLWTIGKVMCIIVIEINYADELKLLK